jgi:hypothetical protein
VAAAIVKAELGIFSNKAVIVGRVYFDKNNNGSYEEGNDEPLPGARVYLSDGRFAITDDRGRYSLPDVDQGLYTVRLDPLTAPYLVKPVPDDQGMPGSRYGRVLGGRVVSEDFPLLPVQGAGVKVRSTTVKRGEVRLDKAIVQGGSGYVVQMALNLGKAVSNLALSDPVPAGAERARAILTDSAGREIAIQVDGNRIVVAGTLAAGTYTLKYVLTTNLSVDQALTDPDLSWDEVTR